MKPHKRRILCFLTSNEVASISVMEGVFRFAATHPEWNVQTCGYHSSTLTVQNYAAWQPDGVIICSNNESRKLIDNLPCLRGVVSLHVEPDPNLYVPSSCVVCDNEAIGRMAAEFLMKKGLHHFAYIGSLRNERFSLERGKAFGLVVSTRENTLDVYAPSAASNDWNTESENLGDFILKLPKPCGLFVAFDTRAKQIIDICRERNIQIPRELSLISVDNEELTCENTRPTLTSVDADFHNGGYLAAKRLDALLHGRRFKSDIVLFPPKGIVERDSTSDYSGTARTVSAAQTFIRLYATKPITVDDVVKASGTSLRLLQMHFKSIIGHGIATELRRRRLEHACALLERTDTPPSQIVEFCSLGNPVNAAALFRKTYGVSMKDWRTRASAR